MEKALGARLLCVAQSIPPCETLVDCGCDHGYVSIYAAENGTARSITASDINRGPLQNAKKEIAAAGQTERIKTVLTNGLDGICRHDCVVIAGMGGETIVDILSRSEWTKEEVTLVLQPMTRAEILREYLYGEGFSITDERFVSENGHLYSVITARYGGECGAELYEKYISRSGLLHPLAAEYADKIISRLRYELEKRCEANAISADEKKKSEEYLASLTEMRGAL